MRIYRLVLTIVCLLTGTQLHAQKVPGITLSLKDVPLETVLMQIKKQTGIQIFYDVDILKKAGRVSVTVEKANLYTVLNLCLLNKPVGYNVIGGKIIVLIDKNGPKDDDGQPVINYNSFSKGTVHGFVYTTLGQGLANASVIIKRSHQGTITNAKGEFVLENVRTNDTLSISYIGYARQEMPVSAQTEFNIYMKETENELDAVMVQAYGTTTKRLAVGDITQITAKQIEKQPVTNVLMALQGMVPGMLVTPTSGFSGAPVKVEIRGRNSLANAPSEPLYVIDGTPLIIPSLGLAYSGTYGTGSPGLIQSGFSLSMGQSPMFGLNPNDIESISVLKDAAATTLYGSRAGNGVVLITTKKGKPGTVQFEVNVDRAVNKSIGYWDMLNTSQYLQMRREALRNDGLSPGIANAPDLTLWDTTRYVDWQKELWKTGKTTNVSTALSGGNNSITFRLSTNYSAIQDISALNDRDKNQKAGVNLSLRFTGLNQKLSISFLTGYVYTKTNQVPEVGYPTLVPNTPPIYDDQGNLNLAPWNAAGLGDSYPFYSLFLSGSANTYTLTGNLGIGYQIINGLKISMDMGYFDSRANNNYFQPIKAQNPLNDPIGSAFFGNNGGITFRINPGLSYSRYIGKGNLEAFAGATLTSTTGQATTLLGSGYTGDELLKSINNAPYKMVTETASQNKTIEMLGRLNYTWESKYIIELSGNRSGSSSFGPGRQFGNFGVAGAAWIASKEKWVIKILPEWFDLIKFSSNYGTSGVSGGDYQYLSQWSGAPDGTTPLYNYNGRLPLVPIHAVNQDYRWQTTKQLSKAVDLGFLNDRFSLRVSFYRNRIVDQLSALPTPLFTGFSSVQGNSKARLQNTGKDIRVIARLIETKNFSWATSFNISTNANKLLSFPGIEYTPYYTQYKIGESINTVYLLHYLGIDPQTGQRAFEDYNKDGRLTTTISGNPPGNGVNDMYIALNPDPKFFGGANTNLQYKNLSLSLSFNFQKKSVLMAYRTTPGGLRNVPASVFNNHWQKPGDIAVNPRFSTVTGDDSASFTTSDGAYVDGSFIRLQTVNISYALSDKFVKSLGAKGIGLTLSMQNVFTLTKYDGIDPEMPFGSFPQPKIFNGSIRFSF
jgi:TonB-linked SusC/RagA family outer membrane protein